MKRFFHTLSCFSICLLCLLSFSHAARAQKRSASPAALRARAFPVDVHSYANPAQIALKHIDLDWQVRFEEKTIDSTATLTLDRQASGAHPLMLDTRDLDISKVETSADNRRFKETRWQLGARDAILGSSLTISIPRGTTHVRVAYKTSPTASGLQWLTPAQTAGKRSPFLFTQAQAIHARSFIPLQDTPGVRVTYTARVRTPEGLRAVMSAANNTQSETRTGDYRFEMRQPIPAYLIALAVGDLSFKSLGRRTGVYAEPSVVETAARELEDTEKMVAATERLVGAYRWERYDLLILPPSFPFGGMENPRLTFATPTILAGDKSLVSLVAHELAHSWSGNLVTNATWSDFWLNEGFTTYLERRIIEAVYGRPRAEMEAVLGRRTLDAELATLATPDEILRVNLKGRDPDEGFTQVPYEKGALFLRRLEEGAGRPAFDRFLRNYFDRFAFQSIVTDDFLAYLRANLLNKNPRLAARVNLEEWIDQAGLPSDAPTAKSPAFTRIENAARNFAAGRDRAAINTRAWTTQEWLHFLTSLPAQLTVAQMSELDRAFNLTTRGNSEIAHQWLLLAIRNDYAPAYARLDEYLTTIGRRKLIKPLYDELVKTPVGRERARQIYRRARPGYHPIAIQTIDRIVNPPSE
jgi:leukotriene A-4 hydrolase/aminopeptidase